MRVVVFDYGSGNIHSAMRALAVAGADPVLTSDTIAAVEADGLVVPGVGAFAACMDQLRAHGGVEVIRTRVEASRPVLGICVGHQILFSHGVEHGIEADGIGIYPGTVRKLPTERLPHMGWNEVIPDERSTFFHDTNRYYFVHSYAALTPEDIPGDAVGLWSEHEGVRFIAAVEYGPVLSTQFHPEKSGKAGIELLRSWVEFAGWRRSCLRQDDNEERRSCLRQDDTADRRDDRADRRDGRGDR